MKCGVCSLGPLGASKGGFGVLRFTGQPQCPQFYPDLAHAFPGSVSLGNVTVGLFPPSSDSHRVKKVTWG